MTITTDGSLGGASDRQSPACRSTHLTVRGAWVAGAATVVVVLDAIEVVVDVVGGVAVVEGLPPHAVTTVMATQPVTPHTTRRIPPCLPDSAIRVQGGIAGGS